MQPNTQNSVLIGSDKRLTAKKIISLSERAKVQEIQVELEKNRRDSGIVWGREAEEAKHFSVKRHDKNKRPTHNEREIKKQHGEIIIILDEISYMCNIHQKAYA